MVTPYSIKLVFVQKITFVLGKSTKKLLLPELHFLTQIYSKSFVGCDFAQAPLGELTALPRFPAVFRGLLLKGGEERGEKSRRGEGGKEKVRPLT